MENESNSAIQIVNGTTQDEGSTDRHFVDWLRHRARFIGLSHLRALAEIAGIAPGAMMLIEQTGSLRAIGRTNRSCLSRALRVSLREMESLAAGRVNWIEDDHWVEPPSILPSRRPEAGLISPSPSTSPTLAPRAVPAEDGRGVPIVGMLRDMRSVQWGALEEHPERLSIRYVAMQEAFALRISAGANDAGLTNGSIFVFQSTPFNTLQLDDRVLLTCADGTPAGFTCFGRLAAPTQATSTRLLSLETEPNSTRIEVANVDSDSIVRAARWIDTIQRS